MAKKGAPANPTASEAQIQLEEFNPFSVSNLSEHNAKSLALAD
jgi:hypothetical protein